MIAKPTQAEKHSDVFDEAILDLISAPVVVLDATGTTVMSNSAWKRTFPTDPDDGPAGDYHEVCARVDCLTDSDEERALQGIGTVLDGSCDVFRMEYACSDDETAQLSAVSLPGAEEAVLADRKSVV